MDRRSFLQIGFVCIVASALTSCVGAWDGGDNAGKPVFREDGRVTSKAKSVLKQCEFDADGDTLEYLRHGVQRLASQSGNSGNAYFRSTDGSILGLGDLGGVAPKSGVLRVWLKNRTEEGNVYQLECGSS